MSGCNLYNKYNKSYTIFLNSIYSYWGTFLTRVLQVSQYISYGKYTTATASVAVRASKVQMNVPRYSVPQLELVWPEELGIDLAGYDDPIISCQE